MVLVAAGTVDLFGDSRSSGESLAEIWEASVFTQPRYLAGTLRLEAEDYEARALEREGWPDLLVGIEGDYGQRVSPSEERAEGLAGRGNLLAQVNWNLWESGRSARQQALALRREGIREANVAFDYAFRAEVARSYVATSLALERRELLRSARTEFSELAAVVRLRLREGVEPGATREHFEKSEADWAARWRETDIAAEIAHLQLALMADLKEVHPLPVRLADVPETAIGERLPPAIVALQLQARERRAQADAVALDNRWRLDAVGQAGPYVSQAYDGRTEEEYYAGLRFTWSPDAAGVQGARARAETSRARSLEAEQVALQQDLRRTAEKMRRGFRDLSAQAAEWKEAVASAETAERTAQLRWREGVGSWRTLLDERTRLLDARLGELAWRESLALQLVDYAESTAQIDKLPTWIQQSPNAPL